MFETPLTPSATNGSPQQRGRKEKSFEDCSKDTKSRKASALAEDKGLNLLLEAARKALIKGYKHI